ncbi:hypothetical protein PCL_10667 [Purpureocillium lilacinum]|uniref:Uncharacterized protein n=1 Tax=Purpureocillium lilacinum TaxID=33203 RepID=A0A2U3EBY8_PURLI|nr:hypothetical protein Purlil1_10393 [Purpureocillium lilacinum]PWI72044.1 hypothetical protein PCL_10667 [Purpureocillium lilacinum]
MPLDLSGESGRLALRARDDDDGSVLNVEQSTAEHGRRRPRTTTTPRHRDAPDSPSPSLPPTRWLAFALLWGLWGGPPEASVRGRDAASTSGARPPAPAHGM